METTKTGLLVTRPIRKDLPQKQERTRFDVYETLCPQQMLVHKGDQIKNWDGECRDATPTKLLKTTAGILQTNKNNYKKK